MWYRICALALGSLLVAVSSGCGVIGAGGETESSGSIGTAVAPTAPTEPVQRRATEPEQDSGSVYRSLIENAAPPESGSDPAPVEQPDFCLQLEIFVFESTQMLLVDDIAEALRRYGVAVEALDRVIGSAPSAISEPAAVSRQILVSTVESPGATADLGSFRQSVTAMVADQFGQIFDDLFVRAVFLCGDSLTDPYIPAEEGIRNVTE